MRSIAPVLAVLWLAAASIAIEHRAEAKPPVELAKKPAAPARATKVDELDALRLRLVQAEAREQAAIRDAARERAEIAEKRLLLLQEEYRAHLELFQKKYSINPEAGDDFDPKTLAIKWGDEKKTATKGGGK